MNIKELLRKVKTRSLTGDEKNVAWQKISHRINQKTTPMPFIMKYKMLGRAFAAALLIVLISVPSARAANNARPGDFLFPIDRALEELQLVLASKDRKDELKIQFAEERVEEVRAVLAELRENSETNGDSESTSQNASNPQNNERAVEAVSAALAFVSDVQNDFTNNNNSNALAALASVAERLSNSLADELPDGTEIEVKIKNKKQEIKIATHTEDGTKKVKIELKNGEVKAKGPIANVLDILKQLDADDDDDSDNDDDEGESDDHDDDEDEEDEDEDDADDDDDDRGRNGDKKVTICHLPGGKIEKGRTISVSKSALKAHLKHGDFEGRCDDHDDDDDGDEDENTKPVITLLGDNPINLTVGDDFTDPGATALDTEDGDITGDIVVGGDIVATTTVGTYIITYDVTDSDGASADQASRTVNVNKPENTKPVITLLGDNPINLTIGDDFTDPGATADDAEDGDITSDIVIGGDAVATSTAGTYIITYDVDDSDSLAADQVTRTVNVSEPSTACSDGDDNDQDGLIDDADPGCHTDNDAANSGSYDPTDDDETDAVANNQESQANDVQIAQAVESTNGNSGSGSGNNGQEKGNSGNAKKSSKGNNGKNNN